MKKENNPKNYELYLSSQQKYNISIDNYPHFSSELVKINQKYPTTPYKMDPKEFDLTKHSIKRIGVYDTQTTSYYEFPFFVKTNQNFNNKHLKEISSIVLEKSIERKNSSKITPKDVFKIDFTDGQFKGIIPIGTTIEGILDLYERGLYIADKTQGFTDLTDRKIYPDLYSFFAENYYELKANYGYAISNETFKRFLDENSKQMKHQKYGLIFNFFKNTKKSF